MVRATDKQVQVLYDLGLSKNEVQSYLKLLELGEATAAQVAKDAKLHRPNVYDALDKLVSKGIVSYTTKNDIKFYQALDPGQLMTFLESKQVALKKLLPELDIMKLSAKKPTQVSTYEGVNGARMMLADILDNTTEVYALSIEKDFAKITGEGWAAEWHKTREEKKIPFNFLLNEDYYPHRIKLIRQMKYVNAKFLPKKYNSPMTVFIYDKGIVMFFLNPLVTIRISGEDVATSFRNYYKMLEEMALDKAPQEE
ncbi:hypothetical protein KY362_02780 [Candidatus Woesearchaeota archaeon]|nr:hypothetical protein [Candidatus Woesearchaeota archaeon]